MAQRPVSTTTSNFGVSRRENHDSTAFYRRFEPPHLSLDEDINRPKEKDCIYAKDARKMEDVADSSVALVVTSPPYFAGKEYEEALGQGHVPKNYFDFLELLHDVFRECVKKLEPGGRIAVNVANLGRKPYRSLSADVTAILQDELKLLLRGEIVWIKGKGAGNSTAWGSFQSAANPVLRDLTERIIVASKGRFDRAITRRKREGDDLPSAVTISKDHFMEATTDVWEIPPESARRVRHPAPFPVELPQRLIELYTYKGDLVLDPFIGSGSTAVAAVRTERNFIGYDIDRDYKRIADQRVDGERRRLAKLSDYQKRRVFLPASKIRVEEKARVVRSNGSDPGEDAHFQARGVSEGLAAKEIAKRVLEDSGFIGIQENQRFEGGVEVNFVAEDELGRRWFFDVSGAFTSLRAGLRRTDTLWKALGKAAVLHSIESDYHLLLLTTDLPQPGSAGHAALEASRGKVIFDAIDMLSPEGHDRLHELASGGSLIPSGNDYSGHEP